MDIKISREKQAKKTRIQQKTLSCCMHGWHGHTLTTTFTFGTPTSY